MAQSVKVSYVPKSHQDRRDLNKRLREEQRPSAKNKLIKAGKTIVAIAGTADRVVSKKLQNFLKDEEATNKKMSRTLSDIDNGFKKMGPSLKGRSWIDTPSSVEIEDVPSKKKKKSKRSK